MSSLSEHALRIFVRMRRTAPAIKSASNPQFSFVVSGRCCCTAHIFIPIDTTENQYVSFNDDFTDWQYASGVIIPKQRGLISKTSRSTAPMTTMPTTRTSRTSASCSNRRRPTATTARATPSRRRTATPRRPASSLPTPSASRATPCPAAHQHRPQENGQVVTMMRTTVSTQPQIIIVACCITLRRSAYDMEALRLCVYRRTVQ